MSDKPRLGGRAAVVLFIAILVAFVVQSALTQVHSPAVYRFLQQPNAGHAVRSEHTRLPAAVLSLVRRARSVQLFSNSAATSLTHLLR